MVLSAGARGLELGATDTPSERIGRQDPAGHGNAAGGYLGSGISRSLLASSSTLTSLNVTTRTFFTNLAGRYMSQTQASCMVTSKKTSPLSACRTLSSTWLVR